MTYPHPRSRIAAGLLGLVAVLLFGGCSDANLEALASQNQNLDDRLTIRGEICTAAPDPNEFPVKVVVIIDQSGSMCVSDPPGAQAAPGLCEQVNALVNPGGNLIPARSRALTRLRDQFATQPNVQLTVVPFETNVGNVWPPAPQSFAPAGNLDDAYIAALQNQLGKGTDYQGAMAEAYARISDDIADTLNTAPDRLPRTRYVVVFLTDGTPYPRCSAIDNLPVYANSINPDLTWADQIPDFCNIITGDVINGFTPGTDRNQNYQIFALVDRIIHLKDLYNVGDIRLHTVLLFNEESVRACGPICQDLYGVFPEVAISDYPAAAHQVARFVLQRMAQRGNGIFQEFVNGDITALSLGALDYTSMISPNKMKSLIVQALRSEPDGRKRVLDSDGDGLIDDLDATFALKTNRFNVDTDNDCFDDAFENRHADNGFVAANDRDSRGCDFPNPDGSCACRDTDGDGLGLKAEEYLESKAGLVDSDSDGIPDGIEARYGLNPNVSNLGQDTDGDGIADTDEIEKGSNPLIPDRVFYEGEGYQYEIQATPRADGSVCYQFAVSNLKLLTPPAQNSTQVNQGYNLFKVWFAESPESAISTDYGFWRTACAWARFQPPSIRQPTSPELNLARTDTLGDVPRGFGRPSRMTDFPDNYRVAGMCAGIPPP
ncbi:MAG TPA: VWA domain-containing protein [Myxococcaceae bacterium]|nr:VWA domain-containing protein [Myxococcaceae bacterium]